MNTVARVFKSEFVIREIIRTKRKNQRLDNHRVIFFCAN